MDIYVVISHKSYLNNAVFPYGFFMNDPDLRGIPYERKRSDLRFGLFFDIL